MSVFQMSLHLEQQASLLSLFNKMSVSFPFLSSFASNIKTLSTQSVCLAYPPLICCDQCCRDYREAEHIVTADLSRQRLHKADLD